MRVHILVKVKLLKCITHHHGIRHDPHCFAHQVFQNGIASSEFLNELVFDSELTADIILVHLHVVHLLIELLLQKIVLHALCLAQLSHVTLILLFLQFELLFQLYVLLLDLIGVFKQYS